MRCRDVIFFSGKKTVWGPKEFPSKTKYLSGSLVVVVVGRMTPDHTVEGLPLSNTLTAMESSSMLTGL